MNILSRFIIAILFVSVVCASGTNAAEKQGKAVLAQPRPVISPTAGENLIEVIGPVLSYSSFLGTPALDQLNSIAVDASGNILVTGYSYALGDRDILIAKLDPTGTSLIYSGIIGAAGIDEGNAITTDREGNAYVTGQMSFPGYFPDIFNDHRLFIMKIDPVGNIVYNASQTGSYDDKGNAITVDSAGYAYVAGTTHAWSSTGLFNWRGFQTEFGGYGDGFVLVINPEGTNVVYSSYIGGGLFDQATGIALDAAGYVYVTGGAGGGMITTPGAFQQTYGGDTSDGFVLKIDPSQDGAASLVYSTYLGGDDFDQANAIAVDPAGHAYVTGSTKSFLSTAFPTTPGAFQPKLAVSNCSSQPYYFYMCDDAFVTKLDPSGASLVYSTFLGGTGSNYGNAIAVDKVGNVIVAGLTGGFFPITENAFQPVYGGGYSDGFVSKFTPDASSLVYSSFLGGSDYDTVLGITDHGWGNLYATGKTSSANFPLVNPLQESFGEGSGDGFISIITDQAEGVAESTSSRSSRSVPDGMIQNRKTDSSNLAIDNEKPNIKLNHPTKLLIGRCMAEQSLTCGEPK